MQIPESLERRLLLAAHIVGSSTVYSTIQAAVDAAAPGAVINVDAGVLDEAVNVNKTLTLRGARADIDGRSNARQGLGGETLIRGAQVADGKTSSFYINANDVTIDGFDIQSNTSITQFGAGIVIAPNHAGTRIINNVIDKNISGLFLANNSASDPALIQYNVFRYNNNLGANGGRGIYSDGGIAGPVLTNVTIDSNQFLGNTGDYRTTTGLEAAISLESRSATPQSNIHITNNTFEENGKAFLAWNATNLSFTGNVVTSSFDTGSGSIRFEGGVSNVTIASNTLFDNLAPALTIDSKAFDAPSTAITFTSNNVYGNGYGLANNALLMNGSSYVGTLNATGNWWGSSTGPGGDFPGTGNHVAANGNSVSVVPFTNTNIGSLESPFTGLPALPDLTIPAENYDEGGRGI
ncbi:MAG TPA: right-handed parallel beta-helix repeat-containing protein, partial [Tepidisphaeraceae bacterium]